MKVDPNNVKLDPKVDRTCLNNVKVFSKMLKWIRKRLGFVINVFLFKSFNETARFAR